MTEYSRMVSGEIVVLGTNLPQPVIVPYPPTRIKYKNATRAVSAAGVTQASWNYDMGQGAAFLTLYGTGDQYIGPTGSTGMTTAGLTVGTGFSTFLAGMALQYGPVNQHGSAIGDFAISKTSPAVITTTNAHGLASGNVVIFQNLYTTAISGMQQIAGIPFVVTVLSATTFSIPWNTAQSSYTIFSTASSTNNIGSYKQLLYPALYAPMVSIISGITLGPTTLIALTMPGNYLVGQQVAFRIPLSWGTYQLNSLPNILIPGSPIYGIVIAVSASLLTPTITVAINSSSYTAFNSNPTFASFVGEKFPQVVPVGDANSGSRLLNYLSPLFWNGNSSNLVPSINGPAIAGAFCNNTNQGFVIGAGIIGTVGDIGYWEADLDDTIIN